MPFPAVSPPICAIWRLGDSGDEWFVQRYHGSVRDGKVYMPPMGEILGQKAGWAICAWLETVHEE
jgi:mono/diheme cytochrome c family protein